MSTRPQIPIGISLLVSGCAPLRRTAAVDQPSKQERARRGEASSFAANRFRSGTADPEANV
jgi:hypothetical protein